MIALPEVYDLPKGGPERREVRPRVARDHEDWVEGYGDRGRGLLVRLADHIARLAELSAQR